MTLRLCLSVYGSTAEVCRALRETDDADCFEVRLDLSGPLDLPQVRGATNKPLVFASHTQPDLLASASPFADFIDVGPETSIDPRAIVSVHATGADPDALWKQYSGSHKTKIVIETSDYSAIDRLLRLNRLHPGRAICFAMGETGAFSRILSGFEGAPWIYTSLPERPTAPGQFDIRTLLEVFRVRRFTARPLLFGIVGNPVSHSRSPAYHNAAFESENLHWIYLPLFTTDPAALFAHAASFGMGGFSVTHPHKAAALALVQDASPEAREIGACNTVCLKGGRFHGINTDVAGVKAWLQQAQVSLQGAVVALVGAGSAARTVAHVVKPHARELHICNRTLDHARLLASRCGGHAHTIEELGAVRYDLLIQTTPVGMRAGECPVPQTAIRPGATVMDVLYEPAESELLKRAASAGCRTINGRAWFEAQAEAQFRWWKSMELTSPAP